MAKLPQLIAKFNESAKERAVSERRIFWHFNDESEYEETLKFTFEVLYYYGNDATWLFQSIYLSLIENNLNILFSSVEIDHSKVILHLTNNYTGEELSKFALYCKEHYASVYNVEYDYYENLGCYPNCLILFLSSNAKSLLNKASELIGYQNDDYKGCFNVKGVLYITNKD